MLLTFRFLMCGFVLFAQIPSTGGGGGAAVPTEPIPTLELTHCIICQEPFVSDEKGCFPVVRYSPFCLSFHLLYFPTRKHVQPPLTHSFLSHSTIHHPP
jgi:hypothetical protein